MISLKDRTSSSPPSGANSFISEGKVASGLTACPLAVRKSTVVELTMSDNDPTISPASIPLPRSTSLCTLIPVVVSPLSIVHCSGAAPRYFGNKEG